MFKTFFSGKLQQGMIFVVIALISYMVYLKYQNITLENSVLEGEKSLVHMTTEFNTCSTNLKELNKKILVAKENSDKYQKNIDELNIQIAKREGANDVLIGELRTKKAPQECSEYGAYLRDGLEKLKW